MSRCPFVIFITSDLSEKNPLVVLPYDATIISLLEHFSRGTHKGLYHSAETMMPR